MLAHALPVPSQPLMGKASPKVLAALLQQAPADMNQPPMDYGPLRLRRSAAQPATGC